MAWTDAGQLVLKMFTDVPTDTRVRTLQAVLDASAKNNKISVRDNGKGPGKKRALKLVYFAPECDVDTSCGTGICDGTPREPVSKDYLIQQCISSQTYTLDMDSIRFVDGNFSLDDYAISTLKEQMNQIRRALNVALANKLVALQGKFADNSNVKQIPFVDAVTGGLNPRGYFEIERAIQDIGMTNPYIVGGQDVSMWEKGVLIGGLNQYGQRIDAMPYGNAYYDNAVEIATGDNTSGHIYAFSADAIKFVSFIKNLGQFANEVPTTIEGFDKLTNMFRMSESYLRGALVDPLTGLMYDLSIERLACEDSFNMRLSLDWDLYNLPQMLCNVPGVTGVFHFTTCLPITLPCPSPGNPVVAPKVYTAPASDDLFNVEITSVTMGGNTYSVGATVTNQVELAAALTSAIPGYTFTGDISGEGITFSGFSGIVINVTADPVGDNFTLTFV